MINYGENKAKNEGKFKFIFFIFFFIKILVSQLQFQSNHKENPILNRRNREFSSTLDNPNMMDIRGKIRVNHSMSDQMLKNIWFNNQKENNLDVHRTEGVLKL